jgi:hypothetical protein
LGLIILLLLTIRYHLINSTSEGLGLIPIAAGSLILFGLFIFLGIFEFAFWVNWLVEKFRGKKS